MPFVTREQIDESLFAIIDTAVGNVVGLVTSTRRFRAPEELKPDQCPALVMTKVSEENSRSVNGLPTKRTMKFEFILYTADSQEDSIVQTTQLNKMIDALDDAIYAATSAITGQTNLGGLVVLARVDGNIEYFARLANGTSAAVVPVSVLIP